MRARTSPTRTHIIIIVVIIVAAAGTLHVMRVSSFYDYIVHTVEYSSVRYPAIVYTRTIRWIRGMYTRVLDARRVLIHFEYYLFFLVAFFRTRRVHVRIYTRLYTFLRAYNVHTNTYVHV